MARKPTKNKAEQPKRERLPRRVGNRVVCDRDLTPEEAAAQGRDTEAMNQAKRARRASLATPQGVRVER